MMTNYLLFEQLEVNRFEDAVEYNRVLFISLDGQLISTFCPIQNNVYIK